LNGPKKSKSRNVEACFANIRAKIRDESEGHCGNTEERDESR